MKKDVNIIKMINKFRFLSAGGRWQTDVFFFIIEIWCLVFDFIKSCIRSIQSNLWKILHISTSSGCQTEIIKIIFHSINFIRFDLLSMRAWNLKILLFHTLKKNKTHIILPDVTPISFAINYSKRTFFLSQTLKIFFFSE
jgi:hypothetical protein